MNFRFWEKEEEEEKEEIRTYAKISTSIGSMEVDFFEEDAPSTVQNFIRLAQVGFYNGHVFFRHVPGVLLQTGCPHGDGTGHAGHYIKCELGGPNQKHYAGVLSMAHTARDMASSQFFICLDHKTSGHLDGNHACFGHITHGLEVLHELRQGHRIEQIEICREKVQPPKDESKEEEEEDADE